MSRAIGLSIVLIGWLSGDASAIMFRVPLKPAPITRIIPTRNSLLVEQLEGSIWRQVGSGRYIGLKPLSQDGSRTMQIFNKKGDQIHSSDVADLQFENNNIKTDLGSLTVIQLPKNKSAKDPVSNVRGGSRRKTSAGLAILCLAANAQKKGLFKEMCDAPVKVFKALRPDKSKW